MLIEFGEFLPDQAALNGGVQQANNVLPNARGYLPFPGESQQTDAIDARCRGAFAAKAFDGVVYTYAGDAAKLYELSSNSHSDVSNGTYALSDEQFWRFIKWGDTVVALTLEENPQSITFGDANFADLGGSPPKAKYGTVVNNFMVFGYINDGAEKPTTLRWSAINDNTSWTIDPDTQADSQELFSDSSYGTGPITGLTGGEYGNIFFEHTIFRMTYVGSPLIFQFDEVLPGVGCRYPQSLTKEGRLVHFIGEDGFYQLIDGVQIKNIGKNKVDQYFLNRVDINFVNRVIGASDPTNSFVFWIYPSTAATNGQPDSVIIYDWVNDKWTTGDAALEYIYAAPREGFTVDDLDAFSATLDALTPNLDSSAWKSKNLDLAFYDDENKQGLFSGTAKAATVDTPEAMLFDGRRAHLQGVRPIVTAGVPQVAIGTRNTVQDSVAFTTAKAPNSRTGFANFRSDGRYHRARVTTTGDYEHMLGVDFMAKPSGRV